uniref:RRM domain-containing protein n=1 Tax=Cynoglossus semilaevis TaxID=244447 RepID=A0A3P8WB44_CYNSE
MNRGGVFTPDLDGIPGTTVVQVTNLSSAVSSEQMRTLFAFLGDIEELRLYPPDNTPLSFSSKVCYVKYREPSSVGVAQHLTNTVFIDRALIVVPCAEGDHWGCLVLHTFPTLRNDRPPTEKHPCLISYGS